MNTTIHKISFIPIEQHEINSEMIVVIFINYHSLCSNQTDLFIEKIRMIFPLTPTILTTTPSLKQHLHLLMLKIHLVRMLSVSRGEFGVIEESKVMLSLLKQGNFCSEALWLFQQRPT